MKAINIFLIELLKIGKEILVAIAGDTLGSFFKSRLSIIEKRKSNNPKYPVIKRVIYALVLTVLFVCVAIFVEYYFNSESSFLSNSVQPDTSGETIVSYADKSIGEVIPFGTYEQDNNLENGAEDIQWLILDRQDNRIMLISEDCLVFHRYHDELVPITWENCSLRDWLNGNFFNAAFTKEDQDRIVEVTNENPEHEPSHTSSGRSTTDRVFILSQQEAQDLFSDCPSRKAEPTAYAIAHNKYETPINLKGKWWLRTTSFMLDHVTYVTSEGGVSEQGLEITNTRVGVRPVIWITVD